MRCHLLINRSSGSLIGIGDAGIRTMIAEASAGLRQEPRVTLCDPDEIDGRLDELIHAGKCDAIVVGGGDGTVRAAAAALQGTDIALGIVPLGTLNRLARDLEIPLEPARAIGLLDDSEHLAIDVGEVNGRMFVCQVLLGLPVALAARRQRLRGSDLLTRARGTASLVMAALNWSKRMRITAATPQEGVALKALALGITVDEFSENPSLMLKREVLDRGYLTLYASKHRSGLETLRAVVRAMRGRIKDDPDIRILRGESIEVTQDGKSAIGCSLDGEIQRLELPLKCKVRSQVLKVLRPRSRSDL